MLNDAPRLIPVLIGAALLAVGLLLVLSPKSFGQDQEGSRGRAAQANTPFSSIVQTAMVMAGGAMVQWPLA